MGSDDSGIEYEKENQEEKEEKEDEHVKGNEVTGTEIEYENDTHEERKDERVKGDEVTGTEIEHENEKHVERKDEHVKGGCRERSTRTSDFANALWHDVEAQLPYRFFTTR